MLGFSPAGEFPVGRMMVGVRSRCARKSAFSRLASSHAVLNDVVRRCPRLCLAPFARIVGLGAAAEWLSN